MFMTFTHKVTNKRFQIISAVNSLSNGSNSCQVQYFGFNESSDSISEEANEFLALSAKFYWEEEFPPLASSLERCSLPWNLNNMVWQ